jgi:hypothetical protein
MYTRSIDKYMHVHCSSSQFVARRKGIKQDDHHVSRATGLVSLMRV